MIKIKQIFSPENKELFVKYVLISIVGYGLIFFGLFVLVELLNINKSVSFLIVYAFTYIYLYAIQLKYLFKTKHNISKLTRFYVSVFIFYLFANIIFNIGLKLNINYLVSNALTIIILMPLRLIVSKLFVFKN